MLAITSISPNHVNSDTQQKAINSWRKLGMQCFSFNHPKEVVELKSKYKNIDFISTDYTMEHLYGKPYVSISTMITAMLNEDENICLINSDIELAHEPKLLKKIEKKLTTSVIIANRNDYDKKKVNTTQYIHGIDVFFLSPEHLKLYPPSSFCMGQCFWDYHIPYVALQNDVEVINLQNKFAFHKKHEVQYSEEHWRKAGEYFILEHGLNFSKNEVGRMNELVFNYLNLMCKKVSL
jgi:hypothetical protein